VVVWPFFSNFENKVFNSNFKKQIFSNFTCGLKEFFSQHEVAKFIKKLQNLPI
jgi:hypothetical protein